MTFTFKLAKRIAHSRRALPRLLAAAIFIAGCADSVGTEPTDQSVPDTTIAYNATNITVTPGSASGSVGQSAQFTAVIRDKNGNAITGRTVTWSATNSAVARISASGYATAVGGGTTTLNASYNGIVGRATVTVTGTTITVSKVALTPKTTGLLVGAKQQFAAAVTDASGASLPSVGVQWVTTNSSIVKMDSTGMATALALGTVNIIASAGGKADTALVTVASPTAQVASVTVTPGSASGNVGDTTQFTAVVKDASGTALTGQSVTWSSSNTAVVTVTSSGHATAIGAGSAGVVASAGGKVDTAEVTIGTPASPVASVTVSPGSASGNVGDAAQFTAVVKDASGTTLSGQTVTWSSSNTAVVTISSSGYATAVGGGSANLVAAAGGKSGQAAITVTGTTPPPPPPQPAAVATVSLSSTNLSLAIGGIQTIGVTLKDASGNVLTGRTVTWTSGNPLVASINTVGLVTGLLAGTSTVTATSEGKSATATVAVSTSTPPSSGTWPNEPAGYRLLSDNPFDQTVTSDWGIVWNDFGYGHITTDNTAPMSPSNVLEMAFPIGFKGSVGPANEWHLLPDTRNLYLGFMWKASNPWQGHSSNVNKIMFTFPTAGGDIYIVMYGQPGGPYELRVLPQFAGISSDWLRPNVNNVPVTLGTWHKIEWVMEFGGANTANGTVKWWMDGKLIGEYHNVVFPAGGMHELKINPTWGGAGPDVKATNDYFRYDHMHISGN